MAAVRSVIMNNKEFTVTVEMLAGLLRCQTLLAQLLIKHGIIKKEDIGNAIDFLIDYLMNKIQTNRSLFQCPIFALTLRSTFLSFLRRHHQTARKVRVLIGSAG
jgi:hypothetical protein